MVIKDHEKFNNIASGIQSLVITTAVIIGGIWTLVTFNVLNQVEQSKAQLREIEQRLKQFGTVDVQIEATQESLPNDTSEYISAIVQVKNIGTRTVILEYPDDGPFSATRVVLAENGRMNIGEIVRAKISAASNPWLAVSGSRLLPGEVERTPFFVKIAEPGLYKLTFYVDLTILEKHEAVDAGVPEHNRVQWVDSMYFIVR